MAFTSFHDGIAIRPLNHGDCDALIEHLNNPNVLRYLTNRIPVPYTREDAEEFIGHCTSKDQFLACGPWKTAADLQDESKTELLPVNLAITERGQLIGVISIERESDLYLRTAEMGYWLAEPYWGRGIMGQVAVWYVAWIMKTFGIIWRIEAGIFKDNKASERVLLKAGLVFEGRKRDHIWKHGRFFDDLNFALVRTSELE